MKAIVWYDKYLETAKEFIKTQIERYKLMGIEGQVIDSKNSLRFYADNGDFWQTSPSRESSRGMKCNISYVERGVPEEFISRVIKPCTTAYPYNAITYYEHYFEKEEEECQITE